MANVIRLKRASGSDPAASDLVSGEPAVRTDTGELFFKKDDGSVAKVSGAGGGPDFKYLALRNAANNGAASYPNADFTLVTSGTTTALTPTAANTLLVSVNGVIQKPNTGTSTPSSGFALSGSTIKFGANISAAPDFILYQESGGIGEPSDDTVSEVKLKVSNSPVNGYFLSAQSGNNGGLTWAAPVATSCTGNSATATALATARTINGTSFDGTANITVTAAAGTLTGNTLNSSVTASSLTSLGDLASLTVTGNLAVDTNTLFVNASTNRVGIGTTSPSSKLHVANDNSFAAKFGGSGGGSDYFIEIGQLGTSSSAGFNATGTSGSMLFQIGGSEKMRINSSGLVGIGTSSPTHMLDISGSNPILALNDTDTTNDRFRLTYNGGSTQLQVDPNNVRSGSHLLVAVDGSEALRIDSSGRVRIGCTAQPSNTVSGSQFDADGLFLRVSVGGGTSGTTGGGASFIGGGSSTNIAAAASYGTSLSLINSNNTDGNSNAVLFKNSNSLATSSVVGVTTSHSSRNGELAFLTSSAAAPAERMRIDSSGNVGIGTTSPLARLHVLEDVYAKGSSGDGSVGIQVRSGGSAISNQHQIRTGGGTGQQLFIEALGSSSAVVTKVNGSERMRIDSSGRLLIGTTTSAGSATDLKLQAFHPSHGSIILGSSDVSATGTATINFAPSNKITGSQIVCTAEEDFSTSANRTARLSFSTRKDGTLREHLRITASGHVKATSEAGTYQTSSGNFHESYTNTNNQHIHWFQHSGNTQAQQYGIRVRTGDDGNDGNSLLQCSSGSATAGLILRNGSFQSRNNSFGGTSDIKLKENIVDAKSQWDDIKAIKFRNFNFIDNPSKKMLGVVAQDIELVSAGLVEDVIDRDPDTNEDLGTVTKHVKRSILYMKAIKCLQEAMAKIEVLEAKVTTLEAK